MLIKRSPDIRPSEITPKDLYLNRRSFLAGLPLAGVAFPARAALQTTSLAGSPKANSARPRRRRRTTM